MAILIVAATPIDNDWRRLDPRLIDAIKRADLLIAEEQKNGMRFLVAADSKECKMLLLNEHSIEQDRQVALNAVLASAVTVFVSDAGTPCVADPDYRFVDMCIKNGVEIHSVPGATSITTALSVSGFPTERFTFMGFPPRDKSKRKAFFAEIAMSKYTSIFLERPYAMRQTLDDLKVIKRPISLSIALGTEDEKNIRGTIQEITAKLDIVKQAFAVVVSPSA